MGWPWPIKIQSLETRIKIKMKRNSASKDNHIVPTPKPSLIAKKKTPKSSLQGSKRGKNLKGESVKLRERMEGSDPVFRVVKPPRVLQ
jgi:hypothetical protein